MSPREPHVVSPLERARGIEWRATEYGGGSGAVTPYVIYECGTCGADRIDGHAAGCGMARLIQDMEED